MKCKKCSKEIKLEYGDPHYPDGKHLGVYGFTGIWLCYDCNEKYKDLMLPGEYDLEWNVLKGFLK